MAEVQAETDKKMAEIHKSIQHLNKMIQYLDDGGKFISDCTRQDEEQWVALKCDERVVVSFEFQWSREGKSFACFGAE